MNSYETSLAALIIQFGNLMSYMFLTKLKPIIHVSLRYRSGLDAVVAWSMRLTDKPLPKGSISHIWHPDREIEGGLSSLVSCFRAGGTQWITRDAPGHSNMVPEAVKVMNERLSQKHVDDASCQV